MNRINSFPMKAKEDRFPLHFRSPVAAIAAGGYYYTHSHRDHLGACRWGEVGACCEANGTSRKDQSRMGIVNCKSMTSLELLQQ